MDVSTSRQAESKTKIIRRRTGCVPCRERKIRCDEGKPTCSKCQRSSRTCIWKQGFRFVYLQNHEDADGLNHTSLVKVSRPSTSNDTLLHAPAPTDLAFEQQNSRGRQISWTSDNDDPLKTTQYDISIEHPPAHRAPNQHDGNSVSRDMVSQRAPGSQYGDNSSQVALGCDKGFQFTKGTPESLASNLTGLTSSTGKPDWPSDSEGSRDLQIIDLTASTSLLKYTDLNSKFFADWSPWVDSALQAPGSVICDLKPEVEVKLVQNYVSQCATWIESTDSLRHFSVGELHQMMICPPWRAAALALSCRNLELMNPGQSPSNPIALELYQTAVTSLIRSVAENPEDVGVLAGCVLLTVYEMMTVEYTDWRRHLKGCAGIFTLNNWNGSSQGLLNTCFWAYARIDIWAAFCAGEETILPANIWFDQPDMIMQMSDMHEDLYAQIILWLFARIVNLMSVEKSRDSLEAASELHDLQAAMKHWESIVPTTAKPLVYREGSNDDDSPFPHILFSNHSSTIANVMYNTGMVLLLNYGIANQPSTFIRRKGEICKHARITCGIVGSNNHPACLVNSLQPMWICAQQLKTKCEKFAALEVLANIERRTGWRCGWRADGLREFWNIG